MAPNSKEENGQKSQIQQYFAGSSVFLTGGTGYLGKLILEKLLRTCIDLKKIFILIRIKKGVNAKTRFEEFLKCQVFDILKKEQPNFREKIELIPGDCLLPNLGLSDESLQKLTKEVNCIFHCAATTRFNETLKTAVYINVRATRDLINLAKNMKHLTSFVYVSTAYSNSHRKEINEEIYEPTITADQLITVVDNMSEDLLKNITPSMIGSSPNTYVFTKRVIEGLIGAHRDALPIVIMRPSIIILTVNEPIIGWTDNAYGSIAFILHVALGFVRVMYSGKECKADMVPGDFVANCAISIAWDVGTRSRINICSSTLPNYNNKNLNFEDGDNIGKQIMSNNASEEEKLIAEKQDRGGAAVYNFICSNQCPITWEAFAYYVGCQIKRIPSVFYLWYYCLFVTHNKYIFNAGDFLLHTIPAYTIDLVGRLAGKDLMFVKRQQKVKQYLSAIFFFSSQDWKFQNQNTLALWKKLSPEDKKLFNFDLGTFDWNSYYSIFATGLRVHVLKDPLDTLPEARRKYKKLKIAHYTLIALLFFIIYKLFLAIII